MPWLKIAFTTTVLSVAFIFAALYGRINFSGEPRVSTIYVSIDTSHVIFETNRLSPSFALGASIFEYNLVRLFNDARFVALAQALGTSELRVGGTKQDVVTFKLDSQIPNRNRFLPDEVFVPKNMSRSYRLRKLRILKAAVALNEKFKLNKMTYGFRETVKPITLSETEWNRLNKFCDFAGWRLLYGLNLLLRDESGKWNSSNPEKLIEYSQDRYRLDWQLGNEPNSYNHKFGVRIPPEQIADDFSTLRAILRRSRWWDSSQVVGPDANRMQTNSGEKFLRRFLASEDGAIDIASIHQYYIDGKKVKVDDFLNATLLDTLSVVIDHAKSAKWESGSQAPIWLSETSSAFGGGAEGLTDSFVNGFMWLDKLGLAARSGVDMVVRQTFYWGHYAMLDNNFNPRPDYWLTLLYKRLVGNKVLDLRLHNTDLRRLNDMSKLRVYAHCAKSSTTDGFSPGSVVVYFINLDKTRQLVKMLENDLKSNAHLYVLESGDPDDLTSKSVKLNGAPIEMVDYSTLPQLLPLEVSSKQLEDEGVRLPPRSLSFLHLNTTVSACYA